MDDPRPTYRGRYPLTAALLAALVVVQAVVWATGLAEPQPSRLLVRLGAVRHDLALERGEWWRLLSASCLHLGPLHLAVNGLFLAQLGALCEERWGAARTLVVYLLAALGGGLLTVAARQPIPSVGASGAILGLAGLFLGATWFAPPPWRVHLRRVYGQWLAASIALTFAIGLALQVWVEPIIDNPGHAGGLLTGLVASLFLRDPGRPPGRGSRALAALLAALAVGSLGAAWVAGPRALVTWDDDQARLARASLARGESLDLAAAVGRDGAAGMLRAGRAAEGAALLAELTAAGDPDALVQLAAALRGGAPMPWRAEAARPAGGPPPLEGAARAVERSMLAAGSPPSPRAAANTTAALHALGDLYAAAGDAASATMAEERALVLLEVALASRPDDPHGLNALAWTLLTRRDPTRRDPRRALALAESTLVVVGQRPDPALEWAALDTLAEALLQLDRPAEALETQRRAVAAAEANRVGPDTLAELKGRLLRAEQEAGVAPVGSG